MQNHRLTTGIAVIMLLAGCGGTSGSTGHDQGTNPQVNPGITGAGDLNFQPTTTLDPNLALTSAANAQSTAGAMIATATLGVEVPNDENAITIDTRSGGATALDAAWEQIGGLNAGVPFRLIMTEAELEAAVLTAMQEKGFGSNIIGLDISLQNGQIGFAFTFTPPDRPNASGDASVVFDAVIDGSGNLTLTVASAQAGRFELPPEMLTGLNQALAEAMTGSASGTEADVTLTALTIADGEMIIEGIVKPA